VNVLDVAAVEVGDHLGAAVGLLYGHVGQELLVLERQRGQHLERRRCHAALIRAGVLKDHHASLLQDQAGLLREEQIGALHDVLEPRHAFHRRGRSATGGGTSRPVMEELVNVADVDCLGPAATRHEEGGRRERVEVELVAEVETVVDYRTIGEGNLAVVDVDKEATAVAAGDIECGELRPVELAHHKAGVGQPSELRAVNPERIIQHAGAVDDSDGLVSRDLDLIRTQVTIRAT
jgi:hypothetical protein